MNRPSICVPIIEKSKEVILQKANEIIASRVDMVEWRIDFFEGDKDDVLSLIGELKSILDDKALLVTLRTVYEGGEENGSKYDYFGIVEKIIDQGKADFVDVEIERDPGFLRKLAAKDRKVKIIGSYHDFEKMPEESFIEDKLKKAQELGCNVGKIACMAETYEDAVRMLDATGHFYDEYPEFPIVTMAMGEAGYVSRLYGGLYGSKMTFATLGRASAPGQKTVEEVNAVFDKIYSDPKHIILIGFMGTGKSTVSRKISEISGMPETDTDSMIVKKAGKEISAIFDDEGEEAFRRMETDILDELGTLDRSVVSCGGGTVLRDINVRKLRQIGKIILLSASAQTVLERVKNDDSRPLLRGRKSVEGIQELMDARLPKYETAADVVVSTDGKTPEQIAREIIKL